MESTRTTLTPTAAEQGQLDAVFALTLSRIATEPQKAEAYMRHAQNLLESLGAVKTVTTEKVSA